MLKQYKLRFYNFRLVIFLLAISVIGIVLVGSAREDLKSKQLVGVILGLIIMVILSLMDYSWISNFQWIMYGANIVLLLIVRLFGDSANGAARWIDFGFIRFQPTELSKIIIILFFARFFMDHEEDLNTFKTLAKSVILLAIPLFLIYEQPDMKNTLMLLAVFCILIYIAGLSYKIIGGMFLIIIPLAIIFVSIVVQPDQKLIKDYQRKRIMAFLYPENEEYSDDIEQQNNSKTAIASGELIGKKLSGDKEVASVNDGNYVHASEDGVGSLARCITLHGYTRYTLQNARHVDIRRKLDALLAHHVEHVAGILHGFYGAAVAAVFTMTGNHHFAQLLQVFIHRNIHLVFLSHIHYHLPSLVRHVGNDDGKLAFIRQFMQGERTIKSGGGTHVGQLLYPDYGSDEGFARFVILDYTIQRMGLDGGSCSGKKRRTQ